MDGVRRGEEGMMISVKEVYRMWSRDVSFKRVWKLGHMNKEGSDPGIVRMML
jgi:hypothetical protein